MPGENNQQEKSQRYFRVLIDNNAIIRWRRGIFHSVHRREPHKWQKTWYETQSLNLDDYPLDCRPFRDCVYTEGAREVFLLAKKQGRPMTCEEDEKLFLAGVCAWQTPEDAYEWGKDHPSRYAVFEGEYLCDDLHRGKVSGKPGVIARVIRPIKEYSKEEFRIAHGLESKVDE